MRTWQTRRRLKNRPLAEGWRPLKDSHHLGRGTPADILQCRIHCGAQLLRLTVRVIIVHEIQRGADDAIRLLLAISPERAASHRTRHLVETDRGGIPPQALIT